MSLSFSKGLHKSMVNVVLEIEGGLRSRRCTVFGPPKGSKLKEASSARTCLQSSVTADIAAGRREMAESRENDGMVDALRSNAPSSYGCHSMERRKIVRKKQDVLVFEVLDRTIRTDLNEA